MAKPDGKVFTPARNFLGTRTPAVAVAAVATAATVTTTATNIDVAEEDVVLGSMHKGGESTISFRQSSDTSSSSASSKKSGRDHASQHGHRLNFLRHHSHRTGSSTTSQPRDSGPSIRNSRVANEVEGSVNGSLTQHAYVNEGISYGDVPQSTISTDFSDLDESPIGKAPLKNIEKRKKLSFLSRNKSSSDSTKASRPDIGRAVSSTSATGLNLEKIESLASNRKLVRVPSLIHRQSSEPRPVSLRKLRRQSSAASSDTDYQDGDAIVPGVEAFLDNSKTLGNLNGISDTPDDNDKSTFNRKPSRGDIEALNEFKYEIVRLTHTLKVKGWRSVSMGRSADIDVERLSGALTNAVYVVTPPRDLPTPAEQFVNSSTKGPIRALPAKLLLRIYGPNVSHLIDRESELAILRRLARQHIGPRLLGTFSNGRFEQYYNARPLTATDLRAPEASCQIAKRMRELHDGIALLEEEREAGPCVWRNWDRWLSRCEKIVVALDRKVKNGVSALPPACTGQENGQSRRRFLCGTEWKSFKQAVEKYRAWLMREDAENRLIFAHNDTQYGNILRLLPSGTSPLLLPANEHKQLIVIDFEYAGANVPGLEFANHFSEWCYDYYDPEAPFALSHALYPTIAEQERFIKAYLVHGTGLSNSTASEATSNLPGSGREASTGGAGAGGVAASLAAFTLDARMPFKDRGRDNDRDKDRSVHPQNTRTRASSSSSATSTLNNGTNIEDLDQDLNTATQTLMRETRLWRPANTAQWVAWGIVQATIPELGSGDDDDDGPDYHQAGKLERGFGPELEPESPDQADTVTTARINKSGTGIGTGTQDNVDSATETSPETAATAAAACVTDFDYLSYARDRALLFWGDLVAFGIVHEKELPVDVRRRLKMVEN